MSIISKQIGWSQESNLLYEILKQLNKLTGLFKPKYKVYTATITQTGLNPPVATVFQDDFNGAFTFLYNGPGEYAISSTDGIFTENKTYLTIGQYALNLDGQGTFRNSFYWNSTTDLRIQTQVNGGPWAFQDDVLVNIPIEIRVYN
jgi:hypothetical protein